MVFLLKDKELMGVQVVVPALGSSSDPMVGAAVAANLCDQSSSGRATDWCDERGPFALKELPYLVLSLGHRRYDYCGNVRYLRAGHRIRDTGVLRRTGARVS